MTGLYMVAARVGIYKALRTSERPPKIRFLPLKFPLSQLKGAKPADLYRLVPIELQEIVGEKLGEVPFSRLDFLGTKIHE